ncbi:hypothetical protein QBC34DRAFT_415121 [Podospora aff. communis PSN243]|uniref:Alcohol acetyltransferase n=1 Tax=Podospora aff. communis PSN243 TaxID=3040156 RepID=A0AAV9G7I1_9PEZI|nr:hypothetical protein QBC34DRAFT_415121 [Podospora aff. communis PSN243]
MASITMLRRATPNEQRTISREDLGFYHAVIIGAVYQFGNGLDIEPPRSFFAPLNRCINEHPFLSVLVADRHTDKSFYHRASTINLEDHITLLDRASSSEDHWPAIEAVVQSDIERPFSHTIPPWRIVILPLSPNSAFIAFSFSHGILDGPSGISFHRTFLKALQSNLSPPLSPVVTPPDVPLPPPFDTPRRLPISWSFLLRPLLAAILPSFLANLLNLSASAATPDDGTWTAIPCASNPPDTNTRLVLRTIPAPLLSKALASCRANNAKLTGLFHQFIVRALSKSLPTSTINASGKETPITNFLSQTAINMRPAVGISADEMGEFATGSFLSHQRVGSSVCNGPVTDEEWECIRDCTRSLAESAARLDDQPIGLLRYAPSIRGWLEKKIGTRREGSYEVSNVGVAGFDEEGGVGIVDVVFAQPGHVVGVPLCFNVVSIKGGGLVYTLTWPKGGLGVADEDTFVEEICASIKKDFEGF